MLPPQLTAHDFLRPLTADDFLAPLTADDFQVRSPSAGRRPSMPRAPVAWYGSTKSASLGPAQGRGVMAFASPMRSASGLRREEDGRRGHSAVPPLPARQVLLPARTRPDSRDTYRGGMSAEPLALRRPEVPFSLPNEPAVNAALTHGENPGMGRVRGSLECVNKGVDRVLELAREGRPSTELQRTFIRTAIEPLLLQRPAPQGTIPPEDLACVLEKLAARGAELRSAQPKGRVMEGLVEALVKRLGGARMRASDLGALLDGLCRPVPLEDRVTWRGFSHRVLNAVAVAAPGLPADPQRNLVFARAVVRCWTHWGNENPARYSRLFAHHMAGRLNFTRPAELNSLAGTLVQAAAQLDSPDGAALASVSRGLVDCIVDKARSHAELRENVGTALRELMAAPASGAGRSPDKLREVCFGAGVAARWLDRKDPKQAVQVLHGVLDAVADTPARGDGEALAAMAGGLARSAPTASALEGWMARAKDAMKSLKGVFSKDERARRLCTAQAVHDAVAGCLPRVPAPTTLSLSRSAHFAPVDISAHAWHDLRALCALASSPMETEQVIEWARDIEKKVEALCAQSPKRLGSIFRAFAHAASAEGSKLEPLFVGLLAQALVNAASARRVTDEDLVGAIADFLRALPSHPQASDATAFAAGGLARAFAALGKPAGSLMRGVCDKLIDVPETLHGALRGAAAVSKAQWVAQWQETDGMMDSPVKLAGMLEKASGSLDSWSGNVTKIRWNDLDQVRRRAIALNPAPKP